MIKVSDIFDVRYGVNLELNQIKQSPDGINFVSRTAKNNGVSAKVRKISGVEPIPAGTISVAGGGSVMESFLQTKPYYSGRDLYYLTPLIKLTDQQKLFYCACLRANKYRFNYGRQANRTLKDLKIPSLEEIPDWVNKENITRFNHAREPFTKDKDLNFDTRSWKEFEYQNIFQIKKGKRLTKFNMKAGQTPYIGAIDSNNGYRQSIQQKPIHDGNTITVNYNGSVAEAFYQPQSFWATDDVNVLYPKFRMNKYNALFLCAVIRKEKYRFNYGRKWHMERMNISKIRLPVEKNGQPDFQYMENYIKSLPFSSQI
ncbi:MAG: restriction endonuclease subunit S [Patescibacteria group bacterium]